MKNDTTKVLSLQELARMQKDIEDRELLGQDFEDEVRTLRLEVRRRAAAENVPPEEIWTQVRVYRKKLQSSDDPEPRVATPVKGIVADVMDRLKKRRP